MARVIGVDPGTYSMDILGFDDETMEVFLDAAIPRDRVTEDPSLPLRVIEDAARRVGGIDAVVAPSGYGMPLKRVQEASDEDIALATFVHGQDSRRRLRIMGLRRLMTLFRSSRLPAWFTPGVIHLPTVPRYRKINKIDMGTADKVFTVAAALRDEVEVRGVSPSEADMIVVEVGYAYTAAMAVKAGAIVDGVGGTSGYPGFLGAGFMDSELAYALSAVSPAFSKSLLFTGGAATYAGASSIEEFEDMVERGEDRAVEAVEALAEAVLKDIAALLPSLPKPRRIYLSGRLARSRVIGSVLRERVSGFLKSLGLGAEVAQVSRLGRATKEAATGAAIIASGLAGGRYRWVVDSLKLRESGGTIFDYVLVGGQADRLREYFSRLEL